MTTKYTNLGAFFRDLPEECPKLAPLLLYVNRPSISSFFKSNKNLTFLIPSESMMSELKHDFESKNFKSLDLKILSLVIPETLHSASDWRDVSLSIGQTTVPVKSIANRAVVFENGAKASLSNKYKSQNISFWELNGDQIPLGSIHRGKKMEPSKKKKNFKSYLHRFLLWAHEVRSKAHRQVHHRHLVDLLEGAHHFEEAAQVT